MKCSVGALSVVHLLLDWPRYGQTNVQSADVRKVFYGYQERIYQIWENHIVPGIFTKSIWPPCVCCMFSQLSPVPIRIHITLSKKYLSFYLIPFTVCRKASGLVKFPRAHYHLKADSGVFCASGDGTNFLVAP
jgi:hypothetical protein